MALASNASEARLNATLDLLERLIGFDTESSKSNLGLVAFVEDYLKSLGVDYVKIPNPTGDKAALFATIGPDRDGGVVLSGHTDVVPVEGQAWTSDPFKLRFDAGRVYGRGACDMKGFDAICLSMIPEFQNARLSRPVHILLSYDEETTCRGPLDTIARFGASLPRPGAVLVGEPTLMQVADAHKSVATYATIERRRGGLRSRHRTLSLCRRTRGTGRSIRAVRPSGIDHPCRHDSWRNRAEYLGQALRVSLGVSGTSRRRAKSGPPAS
jgi:acetylornithine deacetylase